MRSTQVCAILTFYLVIIAQCTISAAQVVTQTGKEKIESYDKATEVLTISVEYSYQWPVGPDRSFTVPQTLIGNPKFSSGCTFTPQNRTIRCPRGITFFSISYQYRKQVNATEDGKEEFTYESGFQRQAGRTNAIYDLFYPSSWIVRRDISNKPFPEPKVDAPGHFQWVEENISAFVAQVRFQTAPCSNDDPCIVARVDPVLGCVIDDGTSFNPDFWNDWMVGGEIQFNNNC
jgi:hypothetical protein